MLILSLFIFFFSASCKQSPPWIQHTIQCDLQHNLHISQHYHYSVHIVNTVSKVFPKVTIKRNTMHNAIAIMFGNTNVLITQYQNNSPFRQLLVLVLAALHLQKYKCFFCCFFGFNKILHVKKYHFRVSGK